MRAVTNNRGRGGRDVGFKLLLISCVLRDIKRDSATKFNEIWHSQGPFWQYQFWDRFVRHEKELKQRLEYMHMNPARKGLVKRPEEWRWSSYNSFALDKAIVAVCPIQTDCVQLQEVTEAEEAHGQNGTDCGYALVRAANSLTPESIVATCSAVYCPY